ncbi:uncharacterized protein LOC125189828 [Salvia hispanica]|uniref:uncharacterized protein LOC125189828 n=1 Tax=Salvia hispanica TaxID=49212 RepID=UPI0020094881|nr:uncharacterized protein LOC125189828 [Salvia hispanica]
MKDDENVPPVVSQERESLVPDRRSMEIRSTRVEDGLQEGDLERPLPRVADPFFLDPEPEVGIEDALKLATFSKFIKEFIAGKTKPNGKIVIGENVSAVIRKMRMPSKCIDLGMFTLPISLGDIKIEHAMCDLGVSINVLPLSIYKKLVGVRLVDTKVVIQLADRTCISPEGVLENVKVKVHDFLYSTDFHVIKLSENESAEPSGVLLGRPFLRTAKTIIDVFDGTICLDYHGEKYTFNNDEAMKKPLDVENLHAIDVINALVQEYLETEFMQEQIEDSELSHSIDKEVAGWCE